MNKRIEELKLKAIDYADATYKYDLSKGFQIQEWDTIRMNEFAKLVVKECADYIREYYDHWDAEPLAWMMEIAFDLHGDYA